ncbi:uncharacterized protein LOC126878565 isoform X2 [Diabrotica virgifera virgifera]|nr:uncharacterized protein LOC126878565 isoform X2 [Diabrotica virgifera virgifera]
MGVLHTNTPNALLTFSCSAKILKGDRFIGSFQDKARRYKRNFETMYQRSILGQAFISCIIEKFGNDTLTIYFKLTFNRMKLSRNVSNIEKAIKDILITDAISRHSVFKNIRFDPKYITVRQVLSNDIIHQINLNPSLITPSDHMIKGTVPAKTNVVLRSYTNKTSATIAVSTNKPAEPVMKSVPEHTDQIKEHHVPLIQGSFKISKTDADITEKKIEQSTVKFKPEKPTQAFSKKSTFKESSITSALYKMGAVEKVTKQSALPIENTNSVSSTTTSTIIPPTTTVTTNKIMYLPESSAKPVFLLNPFDDAPWIPILPNMSPFTDKPTNYKHNEFLNNPYYLRSTLTPLAEQNQPVYTSFTNLGLSVNFNDAERLGSTSLKSHPIPVNKIPQIEDSTNPTKQDIFSNFNNEKFSQTSYVSYTDSSPLKQVTHSTKNEEVSEFPIMTAKPNSMEFVIIETLQNVPNKKEDSEDKKQQLIKNISSIFRTLASSPDASRLNFSSIQTTSINPKEEEHFSGQGQVEVVVDDVDDLVLHTTKNSLITLLPVKSNSGIGRPIRKRPFQSAEDRMAAENRSFPNQPPQVNFKPVINNKDVKRANDDFKIMGTLNFATEDSLENNNYSDIVRYPKMEVEVPLEKFQSDSIVYGKNETEFNKTHGYNTLTAEEIRKLSEISKITDNSSSVNKAPVISNKGIFSSYTNLNGLKILTKPHMKINLSPIDKTGKGNVSGRL